MRRCHEPCGRKAQACAAICRPSRQSKFLAWTKAGHAPWSRSKGQFAILARQFQCRCGAISRPIVPFFSLTIPSTIPRSLTRSAMSSVLTNRFNILCAGNRQRSILLSQSNFVQLARCTMRQLFYNQDAVRNSTNLAPGRGKNPEPLPDLRYGRSLAPPRQLVVRSSADVSQQSPPPHARQGVTQRHSRVPGS